MARADEFMMTAEEIRLKKLRRRRIVIALLILAVLIVGGIFGARPAMSQIKAFQARRHAAKAFAYIESENWVEARKEATAAYQLRPTEPAAIRAVARFLTRTRQPDALEFWKQLEDLNALTREDRQDEAAIALALGETARAESAMRDAKDMDASGWLLSAQLAIQKGEADEATRALRKIFDDPNAAEPQQLQAALLELSLASGSPGADERVTDAWSRIEKVARGKTAAARDALVLLAQRSVAPTPDGTRPIAMTTEEIRTALENHPLSKAPQKLLALDLQEHIDASRRDELIAKGIAEFKNGDASDLLALATWLNSKKEFEKTLEAIPLEKALVSREVFLQYLDALGALERWSEVKEILLSDRYPLDAVAQHMYVARCSAQLGEKAAAENNWQRALEAAAGDPGKLLGLGDYAEKNGNVDLARSAYETAAQQARKLRPAQQGRLRIAQRSRDTKKIHDVLADMLKIWPNDAAVQNDEGYTRLLLLSSNNRNDEALMSNDEKENAQHSTLNIQPSTLNELEQIAAKLVEKNPRSLPHRTFLALARLKQNRAADALAVYDNVTVAPNALTPSALTIHAVVLAANGRAEEAQTESRYVKLDQLLPEERTLLDGLPYD
jgi:tetratricopeptide (TPR) repeat protein